MSHDKVINVLHVDDEKPFLKVSALFLEENAKGKIKITSLANAKQVLRTLQEEDYDVIVSDYRMPQMDGLQILKKLREQNNEIPFIILTGQGREEVAIDALNLGADRYITKGMDSDSMYQELYHAILTVVKHRRTQEALRESEENLRDLVRSRMEYLEKLHNTLKDVVFSVKLPEKVIEYVNPSIERIFGYKAEECINKTTNLFYPSEEGFGAFGEKLREAMKKGQNLVMNECDLRRKNGEIFPSEITTTFFKENSKVTRVISIVHDVSDQKQLSEALLESERIKKALGKSEKLLQNAVQIAKLGFWEWDIVTGDLYWSDEGFRSIGDEPQSYKPSFDKFLSMVHPDDVEFVQEQVNVALNDNKSYSHDFRYLFPNGEIRYLHTQGEVTYDKNGKAIRFVGTQQDITERVKFQKALQASEERLRAFIISATYNFTLFDSDLNFIDINEISRQVFDLPKEEIIGRNIVDLNPTLKGSQRLKDYLEVIKTGKNYQTEVEFEGKFFTVRVFKSGSGMGMVSTDITQVKHTEKALQESESRFRKLSEACFDGIVIHDKGRIVEVNQAWLKMFGYNYSDLATIDGFELIVPKEREEVRTLILSNSEESYEAQAIRKDGSTFPIEVRAKSFEFENQTSRVASVRDMSDLKEFKKALRESERSFKSIFDKSPIGMEIYNSKGLLTDINKAGLDVFGIKDMNGVSGFKLFQDPNIPDKQKNDLKRGIAVKYESVFDFDKVTQLKLYRTSKSGKIFLEVFIEPMFLDDQKSPDGYLVFLQDITERKQAEKALIKEKDRAQRFLDVAGVAIISLNKEGIVTLINKKGCELLGYKEEEIIGKEWFDSFLPKKLSVPVREAFHELIAGNIEFAEYYENPILSKSGEERLMGWYNILLYDEEGLIIGTLTSGEDITERKQAEKALIKEKDIAQRFLDVAGVIIVSLNKKGIITLINKKGCQLMGYSAEEMIGKSWFDAILPKQEKGTVKKVFHSLMAGITESVGYYENIVVTKSGEDRIIGWNNTVLYDDVGKITGILASGEDITERKQAEEEIKNHLELDQLVTRLSSDFINLPLEKVDQMITNTLKDISEFAGAVRSSLFLYSDDLQTITNTHEWCKKPENSQIALLQNIPSNTFGYYWELLKQKENVLMNFKTDLPPQATGEWEWVNEHGWQSLLFVPMIFEGKLYGTIGFYGEAGEEKKWSDDLISLLQYVSTIVTNTLERKRIDGALQKSIQDLQEKNKELHDFAFILTHDIKTPVRNVKLYSDLVLKEPSLNEKVKDYVTSIITQTTHMEKLIEGIYQYSRIEKYNRKIEKIDLKELLSELMEIVNPADNIKIDFKPEFPVIDGDRTHMVQIFSNLIGNAIKFMDKPKGHIAIRCEDKNNFWQFSVSDNGPGIEESNFERTFQIFQTLGTKKGTGLGLAIVKRIVEVDGGKIWLESTVGEGCTFHFTLLKHLG